MGTKRPTGLPRAIVIALHDHECPLCGAMIKKGDKMTMWMHQCDYAYGYSPICLKCDGRFPEFVEERSAI